MSRNASARNKSSKNSLANPDFLNYLAPENVNELSIDQDDTSCNRSQYLTPDVPSSYTIIQVGSQQDKSAEVLGKKKTEKNKRKKSYAEPSDNLVIKQVDEDKLDITNLGTQNTKLKPQLPSKGTSQKEVEPSLKPSFYVDLRELEPSTAEPSVKVTRAQRYYGQIYDANPNRRSSRISKSSKQSTNNNMMIMSISDSTEQRKYQIMKKNQQLAQHDSSNIILNQDSFPNLQKRAEFAHKVIPDGRNQQFNFTRQQKCCHNFVNPQYTLSFKNGGFVLNAKKQFGYINSCYFISVDQSNYQDKGISYSGYLKGNFTGSQFNLFSSKNDSHELIATICFQSGLKCSSICRKMQVYIKNQQKDEVFNDNTSLKQLYNSREDNSDRSIIKLVTKQPKYSQKHDCYSINFKGKSKLGSIKNMALIEEHKPNDYLLMFCKTDTHQFHLEASNPLSPLIAFAIVLSGFDFKLCCQ